KHNLDRSKLLHELNHNFCELLQSYLYNLYDFLYLDYLSEIKMFKLQKTLPPVRNKDYKKKRRVKGKVPDKNSQEEQKPVQRIKSYDYQSWEKFDVDKALETVDKEESPESNDSDSEEVLYSPSDCNLAIALDSKYIKAYARRGAARFAHNNHQGALEDYEMVLKLDPENLDAQNEIKKLNQALASQKQTEDKVEKTLVEVLPAEEAKPKHIEEEQQRRQEAVVQKDRGNAYFKEGKYEAAVESYTKGMEADATNALLAANRAMAYLKLERYAEAEEDCSKAIALDSTYLKAFARRGTARAALGHLTGAKEDFEQVLRLEPGNKQAMNELKKLNMEMTSSGLQPAEGTQRRTVQPVNKPEHLRSTKPMKRMEIEEVGGELTDVMHMEQTSSLSSTSVQSEVIPPPPTNSFQLEADLRKIGDHLEVSYRYLKQIHPEAYEKIFQNSLEPDILNKILKVLQSFYVKNEEPSIILAVLKSLSKVRRFEMTVMFMSSAEKKVIQELFECISHAGLEDDSVRALKKKYEV
uniref:RNA polymerase II-associated protein 3 n=1 Tax=Astyanax mexicanus TaxID=7994 RepID=A0A8B9GXQ2_ASTMX